MPRCGTPPAQPMSDRPVPARRVGSAGHALGRYWTPRSTTVQLHGGIGFTWEHDAHLYHKNAISKQALFGGPGEQLDRLAALLAAASG